ncbi:hypothetical protein [Oceanobacillus chungangensis]|uniref:Uncharacterized protein n=1 Tax=Oceanobacillus chungangensis TaxID=1229152 RepID=A0A3D8Q2D6_9BACI|nr:hypothetical protein [Oceanobacillus chungangensis]RDW21609.1 hypothetical protein CWR45_01675 [Oceanobacillus chungangensis]
MEEENIIVGLLQTAVIVVLAYLFLYKYADIWTKTTHFICPHCGNRFKLSKLSFALALKTGVRNERIVTCPVCGYKGRMPIEKD